MLLSMTAFGARSQLVPLKNQQLELSIEIKTLNSKFLDLQLRLPRVYGAFERNLAALIREQLIRGRVEVNVFRRVLEGPVQEIAVNLSQARALKEALSRVSEELQLSGEVSLQDLLVQPDWLQAKEASVDEAAEWPALQKLVSECLKQVVEVRKEEGQTLRGLIGEHQDQFSKLYQEIKNAHATSLEALRERWRIRLQELSQDQPLDPARREQEIAIWLARSDFQEEIDRIGHHLEVMAKLLKDGREVGRKLDFICQELHREVNTMGSKSDDKLLTQKVVEMKSFLEKIREQVQNIE